MARAELATNLAIDAKAMSMGNAVTADPPGIMSIHFNPAGLTHLQGRRMDLQFVGVDFSVQNTFTAPAGYNVFGYSDDPVVCADLPNDGSDVCHQFKKGESSVSGISLYLPIIDKMVNLPPGPLLAGPLPSFSITPPGSKFTFATATYLPMAAGLYHDKDDPGNFMGRQMALERITYLSPSVGYKINDAWSVGASIGYSYQAVALNTDFRAPNMLLGFARTLYENICAPFRGQSNLALDVFLFGLCRPEEGLGPFQDMANLDVSLTQRMSPSWNLGVLWEPTDWFAWGAVWQSEAKTHMNGDFKITYSKATQDTINGIGGSPTGSIGLAVLGIPSHINSEDVGQINMDLVMPAHFQTGIKIKPTDRWQFDVDLTWSDYDKWKAFNFQFDRSSAVLAMARLFSPQSTTSSLYFPLGFQSTWNLAFGAQYDLTSRLSLRAGYEPRASAIPSDRRNPMVPINDARYYSLGLGYKWDKDTQIDLAIATLRSHDEIPPNGSCMANCTGLDNLVYNPYAGLDIESRTVINMVGMAFRTSW
jgi:long-subunit fatty acid transport protein